MTKKEFLAELEEILEATAGSIKGDEALTDLEGWNSLTVLAFMAMVDEKLEMSLPAAKLAETKSVGDLIALLDCKIAG